MEPGIREQMPVQQEAIPQQNRYETPSFGAEYGSFEKRDNSIETINTSAAEAAGITAPQVALPQPVVAQPLTNPDSQTVPSDDNATLIANDDDIIEKEWVDKAKKIIAETKDDPYRREVEISKLQIEYIRKRYGREIGKVED
ncbi:MAG: hypothetical protein LP071_04015 [Candidatus Nanogingivalaceae bacterium]|jgi:hypothetical protein|nr:hypothetical protein [Candidatus Nanogingivalaceae bacterium]MCD1276117.1 hypothetical protein [Candidatus Nanogingivalaceae bacterium]